MENAKNEAVQPRAGIVDSVLLIDADNDPHMPSDFPLSPATLVRVFLRPKALLSRALQKRLAGLPLCAVIAAPQGGKNAADFVMSMHAGLLHASLPMHLPFSVVTNDKALSAIVEELQRVGRVATLWTSHPDRAAQAAASAARPARPRRGSRARSARPKPAAPPAPAVSPAAPPPAAPAASISQKSIADVAASYARMLSRIKDPPSRLKALLNDIGNRTVNSGYQPADILEELKRSHGLRIDERGRVSRQ
ncbi:MAG TPA: hypothetical protein DEB40_11740 [Elusimicrobia bacterium]|nr:hypothetical protein [Elusimicrobiota bacterium]HBT62404.1 hypothetical protein [Elusimicrobiota bacterium]